MTPVFPAPIVTDLFPRVTVTEADVGFTTASVWVAATSEQRGSGMPSVNVTVTTEPLDFSQVPAAGVGESAAAFVGDGDSGLFVCCGADLPDAVALLRVALFVFSRVRSVALLLWYTNQPVNPMMTTSSTTNNNSNPAIPFWFSGRVETVFISWPANI